MDKEAQSSGAAVGTYTLDCNWYTLYPFEENQDRVVRPIYVQAEGDCIQLRLYMDDEFMFDKTIQSSPFELNSMTFYATPTARRL